MYTLFSKPILNADEKAWVSRLWNAHFPKSLALSKEEGIEGFLSGLTECCHFILLHGGSQPAAWSLGFMRDGARWFSIVVDTSYQGKGYGQLLLEAMKTRYPCLNGWVIEDASYTLHNGQPYASPLGFYLKRGFEKLENRFRNEKLEAVQIRWARQ